MTHLSTDPMVVLHFKFDVSWSRDSFTCTEDFAMRASTVHFANVAEHDWYISGRAPFSAFTSQLHFCRRACGVPDQQLWQNHSVAVMSKVYVAGARQLDLDIRAAAESVGLK